MIINVLKSAILHFINIRSVCVQSPVTFGIQQRLVPIVKVYTNMDKLSTSSRRCVIVSSSVYTETVNIRVFLTPSTREKKQ